MSEQSRSHTRALVVMLTIAATSVACSKAAPADQQTGAPNGVTRDGVPTAPREKISIVGSTNDLTDGWRVLWRSSEESGDNYGYFFRSGTDVDLKIKATCANTDVCTFNIEFVDLDAARVKSALGKDFPGASYYGEIVAVTATRKK